MKTHIPMLLAGVAGGLLWSAAAAAAPPTCPTPTEGDGIEAEPVVCCCPIAVIDVLAVRRSWQQAAVADDIQQTRKRIRDVLLLLEPAIGARGRGLASAAGAAATLAPHGTRALEGTGERGEERSGAGPAAALGRAAAAGNDVLPTNQPQAALDSLAGALTPAARDILQHAAAGRDVGPEDLARLLLHRAGLPPALRHILDDAAGRYRLPPEARRALEVARGALPRAARPLLDAVLRHHDIDAALLSALWRYRHHLPPEAQTTLRVALRALQGNVVQSARPLDAGDALRHLTADWPPEARRLLSMALQGRMPDPQTLARMILGLGRQAGPPGRYGATRRWIDTVMAPSAPPTRAQARATLRARRKIAQDLGALHAYATAAGYRAKLQADAARLRELAENGNAAVNTREQLAALHVTAAAVHELLAVEVGLEAAYLEALASHALVEHNPSLAPSPGGGQ